MNKFSCSFGLLLLICSMCLSQTKSSSAPAAGARQSGSSQPSTGTNREQLLRENNAYKRMQIIEQQSEYRGTFSRGLNPELQELYRKPNKDEMKELTPSQALTDQYQSFLKLPNTGIFKLSADPSCATNEKVIVATENCLSKAIPGGGTAYSFRKKSHQMLHLADLTLENDIIKSDGLLQQGILVNLGNVDLENITLQSRGIKYLSDFKPASNIDEIEKSISDLNDGIENKGYLYRFAFFAEKIPRLQFDQSLFAVESCAPLKDLITTKWISISEKTY